MGYWTPYKYFQFYYIGISVGFDFSYFNPFESQGIKLTFLSYSGGFYKYLRLSENFLITGNFLMITSYLKNRKRFLITFLNFLLTIFLYIHEGFRYRILFLIFPILLFILINNKGNYKKILFFGSISVLLLLVSSSIIELTRTYKVQD